MLHSIPHWKFEEWMDYSDLEPWDESRQDYRIAHVVQTLVNSRLKKGAKPVKLSRFLLPFGDRVVESEKLTTWEQMKDFGRRMFLASRKQDPRKR